MHFYPLLYVLTPTPPPSTHTHTHTHTHIHTHLHSQVLCQDIKTQLPGPTRHTKPLVIITHTQTHTHTNTHNSRTCKQTHMNHKPQALTKLKGCSHVHQIQSSITKHAHTHVHAYVCMCAFQWVYGVWCVCVCVCVRARPPQRNFYACRQRGQLEHC